MKNLFLFLVISISLLTFAAKAQSSGLATVLIDMQEGFYRRGGTIGSEGLNKLVENQSKLLKWSVENKIPVLVFEYVGFGQTDPKLMKILKGHHYVVIQKNTDGGLYGQSRQEALNLLKKWKVDTLIVAGVNGPYCVKETIEGALETGLNVITTSWVIGNINHNPPTFPSGSWYFKDVKFTVFPTLESIIR